MGIRAAGRLAGGEEGWGVEYLVNTLEGRRDGD